MISVALFHDPLQFLLLCLVPGLPLLVAFVLLWPPLRAIGLFLVPLAALPALAVALFSEMDVTLDVPWFFMGGLMGLDPVGRDFLLLASLVWLIAAFFGRGYLGHDARRHRFFFFYLLTMAFNFGLIMAQDMLGFYLFFGLMSFCAYGLIVHTGSQEARRAGKVYLTLAMLGEVLLFSGMVLMASRLPDLRMSTIANHSPDSLSMVLLSLGFGIKAGALPLHVWLPLAHPVAPVPASAVLSGVMIKAGLLGWLRFLPVGPDIALPAWGFVFVIFGFLAAFSGVIAGLAQQEVKTILAYSSISQMGVMTTIVGCGFLAPHLWAQVNGVVCLYALHHGLAKASLFLGTGVAKKWSASRSPGWLVALLLLPCLALAGFPLTSGALAKSAVKEMSHALPALWVTVFDILLPLSALATTVLLAHFLLRLRQSVGGSAHSCSALLVLPWSASLLAVAVLVWIRPLDMGGGIVVLDAGIFWQGFWPVALGAGLLALVRRTDWPEGKFRLPAGDILWLFYGWGAWLGPRWRAPAIRKRSDGSRFSSWVVVVTNKNLSLARQVDKRLMRWIVVGMGYLLLCTALFFSAFRA